MDSSITVFRDIEQHSDAWFRLRAGMPTASEFKSILAKGEGKMRRSYLYRLAGERITGEPAETFENHHMIRGREMEAEARNFYEFINADARLERVGFVKNGSVGCSPDALIDDDGVLEIKTAKPAVMVETILADRFPPEHWAQCQGALWITGRKFVDIIVYWPGFQPFIKRAGRDERFIDMLIAEVAKFNFELDSLVAKVRDLGRAA